jgi:hypothetical protein
MGELKEAVLPGEEGASFCYELRTLRPLVLLIRVFFLIS